MSRPYRSSSTSGIPPVDRAMVDALDAAGLPMMTNQSNDPAQAAYNGSISVDVVASDDPTVLQQFSRPCATCRGLQLSSGSRV